MFLFSKYFIFVAVGIIICFVPSIFKLKKKKKFGAATLFILISLFMALAIVYYLLRKVYLEYF